MKKIKQLIKIKTMIL